MVSALREAPSWSGYDISDLRLVTTRRDGAALVYRGSAYRDGEVAFVATLTSRYVQVSGTWRLALYTQTPLPTER